MRTHFVIASAVWQSRRRRNGDLPTCVQLNEIATWFDRLTMSGCAPRNDRASFDKLGMSGHERKLAMTGGGGFHPHPNPLPSRERGRGLTGVCMDVLQDGVFTLTLAPLPSRERSSTNCRGFTYPYPRERGRGRGFTWMNRMNGMDRIFGCGLLRDCYVVRQAHHERLRSWQWHKVAIFTLTPALSHQGRGCPSTGSG